MKFITLFTLTALISLNSFAANNSYAPTLNKVVVIYDVADKEYSPFFFHFILGETFLMNMSQSCPHVQVTSQQNVYCYSSTHAILVGKLSQIVNQNGFESAYSINWYSNVEIIETRNKNNTGYSYSIHLK